MAMVFELQAYQENIVWMVEGDGETLDGMKAVKALMDGRKVYSVPKQPKICDIGLVLEFMSPELTLNLIVLKSVDNILMWMMTLRNSFLFPQMMKRL